ncbi:fungal-specific transcription factor domain-containing protein [Mycena floridula]|nr:fungal-specific transcription factor domain-containing protein [Mycena floridula]
MEDRSGKKRRLQGACDTCRQRKVRCDSSLMPGFICSNCLTNNIKCTQSIVKSSGDLSPKVTKYMFDTGPSLPIFTQHRETRSIVFAMLSPTNQYTVAKDYATLRSYSVEMARYIQALEKQLIFLSSATSSSNSTSHSSPSDSSAVSSPPEIQELDVEETTLVDHLQNLTLEQEMPRFHGRAGISALLQSAIDARNHLDGGNFTLTPRRMEYWTVHPWELIPDDNEMAPALIFPEPDLLHDLINLSFENANSFYFLLHRPTFDRLMQQGKHLVHREFGMTVLVICAIGARYSSDPRVFHGEAGSAGQGGLSTGWQYFRQVSLRSSYMKPTSIYELQLYCCYLLYMQGTSMPESCWITLGIALRLVQDIGLHRKKPNDENPRTVESELWIRAFWVLMSSGMGRPRCFNSEEYDQDLPTECDDEYWAGETADPEQAFKQPPGKPSKVSFWIYYLKLLHIIAYTHRTVYSTNTNHPWLNISPPKDNNVVVQIDSALNEWLDLIPDHLKWDPHRQDTFFFDQSALLYTTYYYAQILLHKPFIPPNESSTENTSFPSMAICANAARSCCHALDVESRRSFLPLPQVMMTLFASALVLLVNHWGGRRRGFPSNPGREYADVYKCLEILRLYEGRWQAAGRFCDVLEQLLEGKHHEPSAVESSLKRPRKLEEQEQTLPMTDNQAYDSNNFPALPFHTEELGRLPIHGTFDFSDTQWWQQYAPFNELPNAPGSLAASNHVQESDLMAFRELGIIALHINLKLLNFSPDAHRHPLPDSLHPAVMADTVALLSQAEGYSWDDWMSTMPPPDRRNIL